mmetsp:Transcript_107066/g.301285  ORF Transcript_107066/g.301285 Transcript_107066/m.301285 type:complete len:303 (-) Transcript_107066:230-1138(-)|eukprot:CAMPEP_0117495180 /NCGR_PEP_ID=MMETSP0784-20121206/19999_1 /TAXON_ID=39447 /ORGANISM="" /LENGTH=302 /DNA_ID=CAMNT_0005290093 /DNA_START=70 /DNA_END=978 /DNA_ORIENTATION=-
MAPIAPLSAAMIGQDVHALKRIPASRRRSLWPKRMVVAVVVFAATAAIAVRAAIHVAAFAAGLSTATLPQTRAVAPAARTSRTGRTLRRAEDIFDPFGWKGALKDTLQGLQESLADEEPSEEDERMMKEIFDKFDLDKDGTLSLDEFNALQRASEGDDAVYNLDQLVELLRNVNSDIEAPEKGMPFVEYRRLYVQKRLRQAYGTDVVKDHVKIFGPGAGAQTATKASGSGGSASFKEGLAVRVQGLSGAVELNGREGKVVAPIEAEVSLAAEGRIIVELTDGERVALKPANVVPQDSPVRLD